MALSITSHIPSLGLSLSQEEFHLCIAHQVARARRHLEVDVQTWTHRTSTIIRVVVVVGIYVSLLLESRELGSGSHIHPVTIPSGTWVTRFLTCCRTLEVSQHLVSQVDVLRLVWLHLTTLDVVVVTADAVETRVVGVLQLIEQLRTYEGWRGCVLTIQYLTQGIGAEVVVVGTIIIGIRRVGILDVSIVGSAGDGTGSHSLLKLFLCFLWVYIRNSHGITHTKGIGILLPLGYIATHAGYIARDMVGTRAELLLASIKLLEKPVVDILYGIILWGGDTRDVTQTCLRSRNIAIGICQHRKEIDTMDAKRCIQVCLVLRVVDGIHEILDTYLVVAVPDTTSDVILVEIGTRIVSYVPTTSEVLSETRDIVTVGVHQTEVTISLQQRCGQLCVRVKLAHLGLVGIDVAQGIVRARGHRCACRHQGKSHHQAALTHIFLDYIVHFNLLF